MSQCKCSQSKALSQWKSGVWVDGLSSLYSVSTIDLYLLLDVFNKYQCRLRPYFFACFGDVWSTVSETFRLVRCHSWILSRLMVIQILGKSLYSIDRLLCWKSGTVLPIFHRCIYFIAQGSWNRNHKLAKA